MGFGDDILLQIIKEELIISNRLGSVPDDVPKVPLLVDVEKIQKRLRVPFTAEIKELILDLRKPNDLERSIFFHRLQLLGIDWTILGRIDGKGTFKEKWTLYHKPEQIIQIIERAIWGNTVMEATQKYLLKQMAEIQHIPELTNFVEYGPPCRSSGAGGSDDRTVGPSFGCLYRYSGNDGGGPRSGEYRPLRKRA